jgi:hypothetical protein
MTRTAEHILAAMAVAARLTPFDTDGRSWHDVLFDTAADGADRLDRPALPDRALLAALAEEYAALDVHLATVPDRLLVAWLEDILRIPRLPVVPDQVVAGFTVDPKQVSAVVPRDTVLRGGKDVFGNERRYRTVDVLTAHGAALVAVRSTTPGGNPAGRPGVVASAPGFPLHPQQGRDAPHTLRIHSPLLAFTGGSLTAQLELVDSHGMPGLADTVWRWSRPDGTMSSTTGARVGKTTVTVTLTGGCGAPAGQTPWLECIVPAAVPVPETLSFSDVLVSVARSGVPVEAALHNDGALDVTKEFQPFGAVPRRGDAFYVRCDDALAKPLDTLGLTIEFIARGRGGKVRWERLGRAGWEPLGRSTPGLGPPPADPVGGDEASLRTTVGGRAGNYLRAVLEEDFGWSGYQDDLADFATAAVGTAGKGGKGGKTAMPRVPTPPSVSTITVHYVTAPRSATLVEATSGWRRTTRSGTGGFSPFRRAVSDDGATGMVALGLRLPDVALGSTVSSYVDVASAVSCGETGPTNARWEWWDGGRWQELAVADGTRRLRQPGLLRFVAPHGWATGCPDVDADEGRWARVVTSAPERLGEVLAVVMDAVVAEYVSTTDPLTDPSPDTALPPGTIKGTLSPIRGVKKVTNLTSVRGRGPESDTGYRVRATARTRHRNRAVVPWDYEQLVTDGFPEVAAVRCLPHTDRDGRRRPGRVGLVVVPDRPDDPAPLPSVSLSGRITDALDPVRPVGAEIAVVCPDYRPVTVVARILLRRVVAALTGTQALTDALERFLHPGATPARWGRALYASAVLAFLERRPEVDAVTEFALHDPAGAAVEVVEVDACRGLWCSSAQHRITCEEQL